jgi:hypothetical protein
MSFNCIIQVTFLVITLTNIYIHICYLYDLPWDLQLLIEKKILRVIK